MKPVIRLTKKYIVLLGTVAMLCAMFVMLPGTKAFAIDGDMTIEEGAQPFVQTAEEKALEAKKMKEVESFIKSLEASPAKGLTQNILAVPLFVQENSYYCGPASVKQIVHFFKGSSSSQATYASLLGTTSAGTDMTKIAPVLQSKAGRGYIMSDIVNQTTWSNRIVTNIATTKWPVMLDIKTNGLQWAYATDGHFLDICAIMRDGSTLTHVYFTDPHYKYPNSAYQRSVELAYRANANHFRHAMIW